MDYVQVTIYTTHAGIEAVTGRLYCIGVTGTEIEDETDFNEFLEENKRCWDYIDASLQKKIAGETKVKVYIAKTDELSDTLRAIGEEMASLRAQDTEHEFGRLESTLADVAESSWADNWKQFFKPTLVGDVMIRPIWEELTDEMKRHTIFNIDPGMSFGTGTHETTRLCIEAAQRHVKSGARVLDLGCGSGILSLISLLIGACTACAVDIDPIARDTVEHNRALNDIPSDQITVYTGDLLADDTLRSNIGGGYDVVFANIVADVIIGLSPFIPQTMAPDGVFIASGIIEGREEEVRQQLLENGLQPFEENEERGWHCICCRMKVK